MSVEYVMSEKGREKVAYNDYMYIRDKQSGEKILWKCDQFRQYGCHARLHMLNGEVVAELGFHTHEGDSARVKAAKAMMEIKQRAVCDEESTKTIINDTIQNLQSTVQAKMPSMSQMARTICRQRQRFGKTVRTRPRQKLIRIPLSPASLAEMVLPPEYTVLDNGEKFLLYDSGPSADRILIFGTSQSLEALSVAEHWATEQWLEPMPNIFRQVFSVHFLDATNRRFIPAIYSLLPDGREETYMRLVYAIKSLKPCVAPSTLLMNHDRASMDAFRDQFPFTLIKGTFYEFYQNFWQKLQSHGLKELYETDAEFAVKARMLPALAFVPYSQVVKSFEKLIECVPYPTDFMPVIDHFEDTWIGRPRSGGYRRPPIVPMDSWNMYDICKQPLAITGNVFECCGRVFTETSLEEKPTVWRLINLLKKEHCLSTMTWAQNGASAASRNKKICDLCSKVVSIVSAYNSLEVCSFLRSIAEIIGS